MLTQFEQFDFGLGEISPQYVWRADLKARERSLQRARNMRPQYSGTAAARPGTRRAIPAAGDGLIATMSIDGVAYFLVFTANAVDIRLKSNRSQVGNLTGCPWTSGMLPRLVVEPFGKRAFIFHQTMPPQVLERTEDGSWSRTPWAPGDGIGGIKRQLYRRFAAPGVTLTPSARTGSITLTASANVFVAAHVGTRLRLQDREVEITGYSGPTTVTATVIEELHKTTELTVESTDGFLVGEQIRGSVSTATAEVVAVVSSTVLRILKKDFTEYYRVGPNISERELIVGPSGSTRINTAESAPVSNADVLVWTEQAVSAVHGYPGTGTVHRRRLWMSGFPDVPFGVAASAIDDFYDFDTATGDADAFFEEIGDANIGEIRWLVSAEQLLILTADKSFYFPESESNPIRPTSVDFTSISPDGASLCRPAPTSEGVVYAQTAGNELLGLFPTGDVRASWKTAPLSVLAPHLVLTPRSMAYVTASTDAPERQIYIANENGSLSVLTYNEQDEDALASLALWETNGVVRSVASADGECWALVRRQIGGSPTYHIEVFEEGLTMDCATDVASGDYQGPASGQQINGPDGNYPADKVYRCAALASTTCSLIVGGVYAGEVTLNGSGDFGTPDWPGAIQLGFKYTVECVPWPPMLAQDQAARRRRKRILRANVRWKGRYLTVDGRLLPVHRAEEDTSLPPPLRDEVSQEIILSGWQMEPTVTFTHPYPSPWQLHGYSLEVSG